MTEKNNAKDYPKFYYARHMKEGVAGYLSETILLTDDTIKKFMRSFDGKPVYIEHDDREEQERIDTLKETAIGYVTETFYNELDGWYWCKFMIIDDAGHKVINDGWTVSNAYIPTEDKKGGTRHNVPYDREITDGYFTHLALVPNPRYEDAMIFTPDAYRAYQDEKRQQFNELKNSKTEEKKGLIMKFFKNKKEEVSKIDADTFLEIQSAEGKTIEVKVADMVKAVEEKMNAEEEKEKANMDDMVELSNGETMTVAELVNKYNAICGDDEKDNADDMDEEDEKSNESDEEEKDNADEEEKTEKQNHKAELKNAHKGFANQPVPPFLKMDALALGKQKY